MRLEFIARICRKMQKCSLYLFCQRVFHSFFIHLTSHWPYFNPFTSQWPTILASFFFIWPLCVVLVCIIVARPPITAGLNHGRFFKLRFFNRWSIKSVTIYRPNKSKICLFNGNGNNSISANGGLTYYCTGRPNC